MVIQFVRSNPSELEAALDALSDLTTGIGAVVCTGDSISADSQDGFLRGHGTQAFEDELRASQCGVVKRVNKLVSVQALQERYAAELGDVVVGRVVEIVGKKWKLELQSRQEASLQLSAVNLPGGVQRRRTVEDELNMRSVYEEGDLVSAEVQSLYQDGSVALHTRSTKYGKLKGGQLISVPSSLIPRQKQHFSPIGDTGVNVILGVNGLIWISAHPSTDDAASEMPSAQQQLRISRTSNAIRVLAKLNFSITPLRILEIYQESLKSQTHSHAMLDQETLLKAIKSEVKHRKEMDD